MNRRRYLTTMGGALVLGVAGCLTGDGAREVDEDPNDLLDDARGHFADVSYLTVSGTYGFEGLIESDEAGISISIDFDGEPTVYHDLEEEAFEMHGNAEVEFFGESESYELEQYYVDGTLYLHDPVEGWKRHEGVEYGIGGDVGVDAFTDETLVDGTSVVEEDGEYLIDLSIDENRQDDFITEGIQDGPFDGVDFADFAARFTFEEVTARVDPDTGAFSGIDYVSSLDLDADEMEELGVEAPTDDAAMELEFSTVLDITEYDEPVDIELPDHVPA